MEKELIESVYQRLRPEDVAALCLEALGEKLSPSEKSILNQAAQGALKNLPHWNYTSMAQSFTAVAPVEAAGDFATVRRLFPGIEIPPPNLLGDAEQVEILVRELNAHIGKTMGENDYANHRLCHEKRHEMGLTVSRRQYNKMFRCVADMEDKLATLRVESRKSKFARIGKAKLAFLIPHSELEKDLDSTCFIAYYTARCNMRSVFTNGSQVRAFDEISAMLLDRCRKSQTANWWAISFVFPDAEVLGHLSDEQKGELLGVWYGILNDIGALLQVVWQGSEFDRERMVVKRGNDSTTWNNTAAAWNRARDSYMALVSALKMDALFEEICFGKVPRLMAADVAYWHFRSGGQLHPDTAVWARLPFPWEVLSGEKSCGRALVESICKECGVEAEKTAWTAPRPKAQAVEFTPTPELVHGVAVSNPYFATFLRDAGVFSGKPVNEDSLEKAERKWWKRNSG